MSYLRGPSRSEVQLLPPCLDDYVRPDCPARFIDAYVEGLDFKSLGFAHAEAAATGRPRAVSLKAREAAGPADPGMLQRVVLRRDDDVQREHGLEQRRVRELDAVGRVGGQVEADPGHDSLFG